MVHIYSQLVSLAARVRWPDGWGTF